MIGLLIAVARWPYDVIQEARGSLAAAATVTAMFDEMGPSGEPLEQNLGPRRAYEAWYGEEAA